MTPARDAGAAGPLVRLRPVGTVFMGFGAFWGAWAVSTADIERSLGASHGRFGLTLSAALVCAAVANAIAGSLTERWGTSTTLARALAAWAVVLALGSAAPGAVLAVPLVGAFGLAGGVDVAMNVAAAAALAGRPGHLVRFHGLFNAGAAVGALGTGALLRSGASWRWTWMAASLVACALGVHIRGVALPASGAGERRPLTAALRVVRRQHLVVLAVAFAAGAMVEGGIETWGVLSLRERVGSGIVLGAGAAVVAYVIGALARGVLGPVVGARGAASGVAIGALVAAGGLVLLAGVHQPVPAAAGLVLAAAGISMCWPLLIAHASAGLDRPGDVVGGVSAFGYLGFVVGPSLVGWVAGVAGLRWGLIVLAVAAMGVAAAPATRASRPTAST